MNQLVLDLPRGVDYGAAAWVSTPGVRDAEDAVGLRAAGPQGCVCVYGPDGCGKTHLLAMVAEAFPSVLVVDGLEGVDGAGQELLFHEFNARKGRGIVVASDVPVAQLEILPDLKSRLLTCPQVEMRLPDEGELRQMLARWAAARQLALPGAVADYLLTRAERSPKALMGLVVRLDTLSLQEKRAVTVPLAKRVLEA